MHGEHRSIAPGETAIRVRTRISGRVRLGLYNPSADRCTIGQPAHEQHPDQELRAFDRRERDIGTREAGQFMRRR